MTQKSSPSAPLWRWLKSGLLASVATVLAACRSGTPEPVSVPQPQPPTEGLPEVVGPVPATDGSARPSAAATPRAYRRDAATHLYALNASRIYKGKLPPLLYAVGVLEVDIDGKGRVLRTHWLRAPTQAPEVMKDIERTVRAAGPYPAPAKMGKVTWTDTWLWHKSGKFQLDTLTEGQD